MVADFTAEFDDVGVDDTIGEVYAAAPHHFNHLVARQHASAVLQEVAKHLPFDGSQLHGIPGTPQFNAIQIHFTITELMAVVPVYVGNVAGPAADRALTMPWQRGADPEAASPDVLDALLRACSGSWRTSGRTSGVE